MKTRVRSSVLLAGVVVVLTACGLAAGPAASPSAEILTPAKVKVGNVGGVSDAALFIADDKGFFREQALEVEFQTFNSAATMVPFLGTGQLDVAAGAPSAGLLNAIAKDVPLRIVADKGNLNPGHGYEAIIVRTALADKVKGPADLRGKKIAISARDITPEVTLNAYLQKAGLSIKDVDVKTMPFPDMRAALANGAIDMAVAIEPFVAQITQSGAAVILVRNDAVEPRQQVAVLLYGPKFVEQTPDVARRFMLAYLKGARLYNDAFDKKDAAKRRDVIDVLMRKTTAKDAALFDKMVMPGIDPNGKVNIASLAEEQDYFVKKGSQKTKLDLSKVVDPQFADWAVRRLGPYK
jgi:NitT/TauT family transport system substrate-binding protein